MASKSLGTLTIDLIAKVGGFVSGMDRAERSSEEWRRKVEANMKAAGLAVAGMAALAASASVAAAGAGISLLKTTSEQVVETDRWAKSLKMSTQELMAWQYAAQQAGLTGDNIADIFKDINDKVGDAVLNNSGEAAQALDTLSLSAKKLAEQSPDKQLLAISSALEKIPTQAGKTMILESLGNDLSKLLPLFDNNNEKLKNFIQLAKDFGVAPPQEDIDNLVKVNQFFQDLETQAKGLKIEIASGLAKVDLSPLQHGLDDMKEVFTDPAVLDGLTKLVGGVAELVGWMGKMGSETGALLSRLSEIPDRFSAGGWYQFEQNKKLAGMANLLAGDIKAATTPKKEANVISDFTLGTGETNQKTKPDAEAKKLESAFKAMETSYQRQIALIDTTGKKTEVVTELQKLQFDMADGKLVGINANQKKRLEGLAEEVDRLNELKKTNQDNLKISEYIANLHASNDNARSSLNSDLIGSELGEKTRNRMKELSDIQQDYINQQKELQKQYQSGEIKDKGFYDAETKALQDAFNERIEIQKDYYSKADELKDNWSAGITDSLADFAESSGDYYQQSADAMTSVLGSASNSVSDHLVDLINQSESLGDAVEGVFVDLGQSVIKALADMAAQWLVYQAVQLFVGKSAQASAISVMTANAQAMALQAQIAAYASTAAIPIIGPAMAPAAMAAAAAVTVPLATAVTATSLAGMAHDGIDAVPETGTWLLQKGERVTTAETSAKLDATLDRVATQSNGGGVVYAPNIPITINGNPSDATIALVRKAAEEGANKGYQKAVNSVVTGTGDLHKALSTKTTAGRRKG
ncbi:phage tail tape measure protein [Erwinia sp. S43]|uniref:phage tail tape measure protein n=1 Tax=Erwinia sp. S43 TaxID=2769339 RepID=UPI0019092B86|nr:phage tail tape measure protein [Erwinia sp. S43]MBK0032753.1 phage tail tape measure protein [Erwinia sp. S43]